MFNYNIQEVNYELSNEVKMNRIRYPQAPKGWLKDANLLLYE